MALSDSKLGFLVRGPAEDQYETLKHYRVLLAPLRYGAGIKGKISDAWSVGTAVVTTPIGAEGMTDADTETSWPYEIAQDAKTFAESACEVYSSAERWQGQSSAGLVGDSAILQSRLKRPASDSKSLEQARAHRDERRRENLVGAMLRQNLHRSTKYLSKWIELKQSHARSSLGTGTPVA